MHYNPGIIWPRGYRLYTIFHAQFNKLLSMKFILLINWSHITRIIYDKRVTYENCKATKAFIIRVYF